MRSHICSSKSSLLYYFGIQNFRLYTLVFFRSCFAKKNPCYRTNPLTWINLIIHSFLSIQYIPSSILCTTFTNCTLWIVCFAYNKILLHNCKGFDDKHGHFIYHRPAALQYPFFRGFLQRTFAILQRATMLDIFTYDIQHAAVNIVPGLASLPGRWKTCLYLVHILAASSDQIWR